jgi:hypothetical protein
VNTPEMCIHVCEKEVRAAASPSKTEMINIGRRTEKQEQTR